MTTNRERDAQSATDAPVAQLACTACEVVYQPDRAAFESGTTGCPRCGGWTWVAQFGAGQDGGDRS